jgi:hypothetical protein
MNEWKKLFMSSFIYAQKPAVERGESLWFYSIKQQRPLYSQLYCDIIRTMAQSNPCAIQNAV